MGSAATTDLDNLIGLAFNLIDTIFGLDDGSRLEAEKRAANTAIQLSKVCSRSGLASQTRVPSSITTAVAPT